MVALLAVCLAAPVADLLDRWDSGGDDVEGGIVVLVLCVGLGILLGIAAAGRMSAVRVAAGLGAIMRARPRTLATAVHRATLACIGGPPVLPLRV